ncbi:polymer-forming cytoskeletal protein [Maribacter confluentis]|uniref:Polymer-forming cytoskeletal protein n=1 Tax=Maribacter confluentis TaxID=1656093 RepID=A0ABT8RTS3_9FLAO|nr:polymer-forming cytoskeletal protein [Maribacter confluentis]MDO1513912.1 polymer-forming cytoskeletal protein [Maribacter confluentis]
MKTLLLFSTLLISITAYGQQAKNRDINITEHQKDDFYMAGENIDVNAIIDGDLVLAGSKITVKDTVQQDLIIAGGEIMVIGFIKDDIRAAGGKLTIDAEVGDDIIIAGGEVLITENAIIHGNLINFSGDIEMNGQILGNIKSHSGEIKINGTVEKEAEINAEKIYIDGIINGTSKLAAESITIGKNAIFNNNVNYWSEEGSLDFKNSLDGVNASFDESLKGDQKDFTMKSFGIAALGFWIFYLLSAFLVILIINWAFGNYLHTISANLDTNILRNLGYGAIYIFGIPLVILFLFLIIIGIPIAMFLGGFYLFSLLFGHLVTALLCTYFFETKGSKNWGMWTKAFITLGIAAAIRLMTFIPFLGPLLAFIVIAIGYGLIVYTLFQKKKAPKFE